MEKQKSNLPTTPTDKVKQLLRSLSIKQGRKYDSPLSAREIKGFVTFHQLNLDEVLKPLEEFKTYPSN
jgi:phosphatidylserine decarboxylase